MDKMDKANAVLGEAIKYLEYLQQRVSDLEELQAVDEPTKPAVDVNELPRVGVDEKFDEQKLPEIEARVGRKKVLVKIQCEKGKGNLGKILCEVERLDLAVVNVGVLPIGSLAIDITIVAEMKKELRLSTTDLVTALGLVLQDGNETA